jgi:predicted O-methyltransferase YrrM
VFVHALLGGNVRATAIDPFENYSELPAVDMSDIETRFRTNIKAAGVEARVLRGSSIVHVPRLIEAGEKFDLIYVDGSHAGLDVMSDATLCWRLLEPDGLMIFDDYLMPEVGRAIDAFVKLARPQIVDAASQVFLRKA